MEASSNKKMKDFKAFRVKPAAVQGNRVKPVNDFLEFKKEDIEQAVSQRFEEQVNKYPDKIAVSSNKNSLTYNCLNHSARRTAQSIQKFFGGAGGDFSKKPPARRRQVALLFSHGADMIAGIIGVLKTGKVYVPLDPGYPEERLVYILKDADVGIIVSHDKHYQLARRLGDTVGNRTAVINIDRIEEEVPEKNLEVDIKPGDPAYILYTSGSTGRPKGVMQNHRNVLHFARVYTNALHIHKDDRLTLLSFYGFDAAKMDIYGALLNGATLYPFDLKRAGGPARLPGWMEEEGITIYHSIPTVYRYFTGMLDGGEGFKTLRFIVLGGEAVYRRDIEIYKQHFSHAIFINGLGPTESTVTLQYFMDKETEIMKESVPVGYPAAETEVLLIGENNRLIKHSGVGEILYKSDYLALGYVNLPGKTHEAFGPDPVGGTGRVFRSGDLGRRLKDGSIEYAGRKDFQFKVRGFRVEPAEIEGRLDQAAGIKKSVVVCRRHAHAGKENYLAAYYTTDDGKDIDEGRLIAGLKERLPDYMVPDIVLRVETFPLTATGKIDRGALTEAELPRGLEYTAPANEVEAALVKVWQGVLKVEKVGVTDNFFVLGGNSLRAIVLAAEIHKALQVKVSLAEIFKRPTIRELAGQINAVAKESFAAVQAVEKREYYPLSSAQKRLYFLQQVDAANTAYNMPLAFPLGKDIEKDKIEFALKALIARHASLRTSFIMVQDDPVQRVHVHGDLNFERAETIENIVKPFDLSRSPLLRSGIIKTPDGDYTWLVDIHHIVSDGTSQAILIEDFISLYNGERLEPLRLQYKDFAQRQNDLFSGDKIKACEAYWLDLYRGEIPRLHLPGDLSRPEVFTFAGDVHEFELGPENAAKFRALASRAGGTLYMGILAVLNTLFYKYTGQTDIIIGTGTAGRPHVDLRRIIGMFVNTLPMRNYPRGGKTYDSFLKEVAANSVEAFENQDVQFEELIDKLAIERNPSRNPLFDISMVVQNFMPQSRRGEPGKGKHTGHTPAKFDMTFVVREAGDGVYIQLEYYTAVFKEETIRRLAGHFKRIVKTVVNQPLVKLKDIDIISEEEKKQILYVFNGTAGDYPGDKTIQRLFEEQAGKSPGAAAVVDGEQVTITYNELNKKAAELAGMLIEKGVAPGTAAAVMMERSIGMIIAVLGILKAGAAYLPINSELPEGRKEYILKESGAGMLITDGRKGDRQIKPLRSAPCAVRCAYIIYTSGSTGKPKGVMVEHRNVVRLVKNTNYMQFKKSHRLLQNGSLEFDISTFEIWGSLLNGAALYLAGKEALLSAESLGDRLVKYDISILHLIPQLFNQLAEQDPTIFRGLDYLLVGGDLVRPAYIDVVRKKCSSIKILHMYGPTENTTFSSFLAIEGNYEGALPIGKPIANSTIYILGRNHELMPVGVPGEICTGGDGAARGYLNNPELTMERFLTPHPSPLYKTGDLGRWLPDGNIEFLGRMDFQVKIRGVRMELQEIENRLLEREDIKEAVVTAREEGLETTGLCAYFVSGRRLGSSELRAALSLSLPLAMIPAYFVQMDRMPLTSTGKIDRKALPAPVLESGGLPFTAPGSALEEKLVEIWAAVLGVEGPPGIDDNFFHLGGHSLKAMAMIAKIHETLAVKIPLVEVFNRQTVRRLAEYILRAGATGFSRIEAVEKKEYYPLSPAQKRLYFIQQMVPESTAYNMQINIPLDAGFDIERLEFILKELIARHESLRTSFAMIAGQPVQVVHGHIDFAVDVRHSIEGFIRPFDLAVAPLLRSGVIETHGEHYTWVIDIHHIISDGVSQDILSGEFKRLTGGEDLKPLRLQYKDYSEWLNRQEQKAAVQKQEEYWLETLAGELPVLDLPLDYPRPVIQGFEGGKTGFSLEQAYVKGLKGMAGEWDVTLHMSILAIFTVFLSKLSGREDIIVGTPTAGRGHADLQMIIGMFVNTLPARNYPEGQKVFAEFLKEVKQSTIAAYENQDYPFEDLVNKVGIERDTGRHPVYSVVFNFLTPGETNQKLLRGVRTGGGGFLEMSPPGRRRHRPGTSKFDLLLTVMEIGEGLIFDFEYCTKLFKPETIDRFINYFIKTVSSLVENPSLKLSEADIMDEEERNKLLFEFNRTEAEYPKDKTIHQLFADQADRTPDSIAVTGLSYKELNKKSHRLAQRLKEKGVGPDTIAGIKLEPSIDMIVAVLAILKAGGAYLPIDPAYPEERQQYMLTDSSANILITTGITEKKSPSPFTLHPSPFTSLAYIIYTSGTTGRPKGTLIEHSNVVRLMKNSLFPFDFGGGDVWTLFHSYCFDFSVWEIWGALLYGGRLVIVPPAAAKDPRQFLELLVKENVTVLNQTPAAFYSLSEEALKNSHSSLYLRYVIFGGEALAPARLKEWRETYPETKLVNMYGITETTVHVTFKEITEREIALNQSNIGKPIPTLNIYILNKYQSLQPCGAAGELCVSGKGLARGYLNQPELTVEKFFYMSYTSYMSHLIYKSGDLARWLDCGELEYLGRIDQQVKIRGYRVELGEIENRLSAHGQIKEAVVTAGSKDIAGSYLAAYIVPHSPGSVDTAELREYLARQLPAYMVPAYFVYLDKLPLTPNGKLDKAALPLPEPEAAEEYIAPKDKVEEKLVEIWREVLELEGPISTHADFFELGGHSLNAVQLVNAIHKALNVKVSIRDVFQFPSIAGLAGIIRANKLTPFIEIEKLPPRKYYELSYAQKRLWVLYKRNPLSGAFNMPKLATFHEKVDRRIIGEAIKKMSARHESLRTCFAEVDGEVLQEIVPEAPVKLAAFDISHLPADQKEAQRRQLFAEESSIPFDIATPPLLRVKMVRCSDHEYDLVFNMHHLISDGWSLEVLKKEFFLFYDSLEQGNPADPPGLEPVEIQYKEYAAWHNRLLEDKEKMKVPLESWKKRLAGTPPRLNLPYDFPPEELTAKKSAGYRTAVGEETVKKLRTLARQYNASLFMVLLAGVNILLWRLRGQEDILIAMPGAARQHEDLKNTIGLFVNVLALRTKIDKEETFPSFLKDIQTDTLEILEYQDYPLELICEQLNIKYPEISFFFNMINIGDTHRQDIPGVESYHLPNAPEAKFDVVFYLTEYRNGIKIECNYFSQLFMPETIEKMMQMYILLLEKITAEPGKKLKEYRSTKKKRKLKNASGGPAGGQTFINTL